MAVFCNSTLKDHFPLDLETRVHCFRCIREILQRSCSLLWSLQVSSPRICCVVRYSIPSDTECAGTVRRGSTHEHLLSCQIPKLSDRVSFNLSVIKTLRYLGCDFVHEDGFLSTSLEHFCAFSTSGASSELICLCATQRSGKLGKIMFVHVCACLSKLHISRCCLRQIFVLLI